MDNLKTQLDRLDHFAPWLVPLLLRLLLANEFWEAGVEKINNINGFVEIQSQFPFPFNLLSADINWQLAMLFEIIGALALVLGLGTRVFAACLSILTLVAIYTVHAGFGYTIIEGGWKLQLFYLVMLLPLILTGPGKLSLDHVLRQRNLNSQRRLWS
jgi:putative oxidoreductase